MATVTPLFQIDASIAFTDDPSEKNGGDLLEAALGLAFIDNHEVNGGGAVLKTLYDVLPCLVRVCVRYWSG